MKKGKVTMLSNNIPFIKIKKNIHTAQFKESFENEIPFRDIK